VNGVTVVAGVVLELDADGLQKRQSSIVDVFPTAAMSISGRASNNANICESKDFSGAMA
jgi:hypothetical protein